MHEHQAHDGQVARGTEAGPEARHFIDREGHDVELGFPHSQPADLDSWPAEAHRPALQEGLMKPVRDLAGSIGELAADGAISSSNAVVDGGGRRRAVAGWTGIAGSPAGSIR